MTPAPEPVEPPRTPSLRDWMVTTAGIACETASMTADDSSMRTWDTFVASGCWLVPAGVVSGWTKVAMAAPERDPEMTPATTASATMRPLALPERSAGRPPRAGGRVDQVWPGCCQVVERGG